MGMATFRKDPDLEILVWDHHVQPETIHASWNCHAPVGANITLMLRCLKAEQSLSPIQATIFLAGLYEDTGQLTFTNTTAEDAYAAGYLLEHGADLKILSRFLRPAYGEKQKSVLFEMLKTCPAGKRSTDTPSASASCRWRVMWTAWPWWWACIGTS